MRTLHWITMVCLAAPLAIVACSSDDDNAGSGTTSSTGGGSTGVTSASDGGATTTSSTTGSGSSTTSSTTGGGSTSTTGGGSTSTTGGGSTSTTGGVTGDAGRSDAGSTGGTGGVTGDAGRSDAATTGGSEGGTGEGGTTGEAGAGPTCTVTDTDGGALPATGKHCEDYCACMASTCEGGGDAGTLDGGGPLQSAITMANCMDQCMLLQNGTSVNSGNTFCCRMEHCWNAQQGSAALHCQHAAGLMAPCQ